MADTKLEIYVEKVLPAERRAELLRSLPDYIKPAVFERNLLNALMQNPELMNYHPSLIYREVSKAAGLGLLLDPLLGEAYLPLAWNSQAKEKQPQLRIGYKGLMKLARASMPGCHIYAHEVCEADLFRCSLGDDKRLLHEPNVFGERGSVKGYYAVIKFADGTSDFEPMSLEQVHEIRERSDGWQAFKAGKIKSTPWSTDEVEMGKKTVIRRLMKRQSQSSEMAQALAIEDRAEFPQYEPRRPGRPLKVWAQADALPPPPAPELPPDDGPPVEQYAAHTADDVQDTGD